MNKRIAAAAFVLAVSPVTIGQAEERRAYFGDLHLHTRMSFDAYSFGTDTLPEDSYRFAMGEPVKYLGQTVKRHAPLDFLAVTDHSEYLGILRIAADEHGPFAGTDWQKALSSGDPKEFRAAYLKLGLSFAGVTPKPIPEFRTAELIRGNWQYQIDAAEKFNQPGKFTTFVAYEWSASSPKFDNLHRNVIFRGPKYPLAPFSAVDSGRPEDLWAYADNNRRNGIDSVIIPHNSNLSGGLMFGLTTSDGQPITRVYAESRARNELVVEITQHKGNSDTRPELSPNDEFADFEQLKTTTFTGGFDPAAFPGNYVRSGLGHGLEIESRIGVNPYPLGLIGATDFHSGISATEPDNYPGAQGLQDSHQNPKEVFTPRNNQRPDALWALNLSSGGLTGIWADENTREALFAGLKRKEVFATSGTRISVRVFAGWSYPDGMTKQSNWADVAYRDGVPMGGHLTKSKANAAGPRLLLQAVKDPNSGNLDRIQVVKIWQKQGAYQEKVFDAVWSGDRKIDAATGKVPPVGNTVNKATAEYTNAIGAAELKGEWQDPEFDPKARAIYYARVLEIPTPRWSTYLAVKSNIPLPPGIPASLQQRAWSSPIYYDP